MYNSYPSDAAGGAAAAGVFAFLGIIWLFTLVLVVIVIAGMWKVFTKAGKPGWAAIIPIYNIYILLEIVGRPTWWLAFLLLPFIPFIGGLALLVVLFIIYWDTAKSFGKDVGYAIGLTLLSFVFWPMLGFGSAQYLGPMASGFGLPDRPAGGGYAGGGGGYAPPPPGYTPPAPGYTPPPAPGYTPPPAPGYAPPPAPPAAPAPAAPAAPAPSAPPAAPPAAPAAPEAPPAAPPAPPAPPA